MTVSDWDVCIDHECKPMSAYVGAADPVVMNTCE